MMVTKQALHVAGVARSPQLQYELSEAIADGDSAEFDLRIGGLQSWPRGCCAPSGRRASSCSRSTSTSAARRRDRRHPPADRPRRGADVLRSADHKARRWRQRSPAQGRGLTFSRATGGAGATTLAVNVAHGLAQPGRQAKVCLIDLDLQFGTVALQLDLDPTDDLFDLAHARRSFDASLFLSSLVEHRSGLHVLPSQSAPILLEAISPAVVRAARAGTVEFDYVIVDLPCALAN